mgnify:CR=1 FL=1
MSRPEWIPRLAAESLVVVLSILLALAADAWWEGRETRADVEASLTSIRAEIMQNRSRLGDVAPYHRSLADTLLSLASTGAARVPADLYARGWLVTPELTAAAWDGARATGTTSDVVRPSSRCSTRASWRGASPTCRPSTGLWPASSATWPPGRRDSWPRTSRCSNAGPVHRGTAREAPPADPPARGPGGLRGLPPAPHRTRSSPVRPAPGSRREPPCIFHAGENRRSPPWRVG